jgi:hypothetical protein
VGRVWPRVGRYLLVKERGGHVKALRITFGGADLLRFFGCFWVGFLW